MAAFDLQGCLDALADVLPDGVLSLDSDDRANHAIDRWPANLKRRQQGLHPSPPAAVVRPTTLTQVQAVVMAASQYGVPLSARGAGSSVVGQAVPEPSGLSVDLCALDAVVDIDDDNLLVRVPAGAIGAEVEAVLNERGLTLNFSPQSLSCSTVGGWVATRATGQFSSRWGGIEHALVGLTAVLPSGQVFRSRAVPRPATGPDVKQLLVGAEGTMAIVTEVVLRVYPRAEARQLQTVHFSDLDHGLDAVRRIMRAGLRPFLLRLYDEDESPSVVGDAAYRGAVLLLGTEGVERVARAELEAAAEICEQSGGACAGQEVATGWMERRYDFSRIQSVLDRPGGVAETIDVADTWSGIRDTHRLLKETLAPLADQVLGHFSHAYSTGTSLYLIVLGETASAAEAERRLAAIWEAAMTTCLETGAAIAHHHGIGLARLPWLQHDAASEIALLRQIKCALDPEGILAPGRLGLQVSAS